MSHEAEPLMFSEKAVVQTTVSMFVLQVRSDRDKFTVYLDVKHFSPDDLSVRICDDYVEILGKHGERQVVILIFVNVYVEIERVRVISQTNGNKLKYRAPTYNNSVEHQIKPLHYL